MTAPAWYPDDPELSWTAYRYVAGELPPDEADAFEALLGADQRAREAVATAVELTGAIARRGTTETIPMRPRRRTTRALCWVASGIAAGLLIGFGLDRLILNPPATARPRMAEEVVHAWYDLRLQAAESDPLHAQLALNDDTAELAATLSLESAGEGELPSWMAVLATLPAAESASRGEN